MSENFKSSTENLAVIDLFEIFPVKKKRLIICTPCNGDMDAADEYREFTMRVNDKDGNKLQFTWYHTGEFGFEDILFHPKVGLRQYLFYRHLDFRPQLPFKRVSP